MATPTSFKVIEKNLAALNESLVLDVWGDSSVMLHLKNVGTAPTTAGVLNFEASINSSDGINGDWFSVNAVQTVGNTIATNRAASALAAGAIDTYAWKINVAQYRWFRVRVSTAFTASSIMKVTALTSDAMLEFTPAIPSHGISGTVTVSGTATVVPGSASTTNAVGAASNNATLVTSTAASLLELTVFNPTAALVYLKLYNKATAPAPATDSPVLVVPVPVNGTVSLNFGPNGKRFATGIGYAIVAGPLNNDNVAVAAGVVLSATRI